ncbi:hypothetical protein [Pseudoclavibacter sp. VKM Ac-2867]|uniref:hypothetical protein n=1 Tax=Pseudoclavibacter sp. VKM Ac-2867 TaxID=2783829 RepID=UPI00188AB98F|nr:hypothetical protein [Pseudoclavibacter sp. VKM Ac-2867]MBF4458113.1 hypothetical protein [Pseudoclavibacter sp. VKM Ac-2867]
MNEPAVQLTAEVTLDSLAVRCETVRERVDSKCSKRIVCWCPVATRPVDGDTYEPILHEPVEVFNECLDMLQWVTEGGVRAEVRHALEVGTMSEKESAISHGNAQIRGTVTLEGDALAAERLTSELSIALLYMAQRATRKKGW